MKTFTLQSLADSGEKTISSGRFLRPDFQTVFPKEFLFALYSKFQNV